MPGIEPIDLKLYNAFHNLTRMHFKLMTSVSTTSGIHPGQFRCIAILANNDGISQSELAKHLHIERATASVMLKKMQLNGLITRKTDSQDLRIVRLHLTKNGREKFSAIVGSFADILNQALKCIENEDKVKTIEMFEEIACIFETMQKNRDFTKEVDVSEENY